MLLNSQLSHSYWFTVKFICFLFLCICFIKVSWAFLQEFCLFNTYFSYGNATGKAALRATWVKKLYFFIKCIFPEMFPVLHSFAERLLEARWGGNRDRYRQALAAGFYPAFSMPCGSSRWVWWALPPTSATGSSCFISVWKKSSELVLFLFERKLFFFIRVLVCFLVLCFFSQDSVPVICHFDKMP